MAVSAIEAMPMDPSPVFVAQFVDGSA